MRFENLYKEGKGQVFRHGKGVVHVRVTNSNTLNSPASGLSLRLKWDIV
jgi:hypothetical protein